MTVERSWRKGNDDSWGLVDILVQTGVLVPDTRLQAIADVWNDYKEDETLSTRHLFTVLEDALTEENET